MPEVRIILGEEDFVQLWKGRAEWKGGKEWGDLSRFEPSGSVPISREWVYAYWIGECWAYVVLMRSYLVAIGAEYQIANDAEEGEYMIFTDYKEGK